MIDYVVICDLNEPKCPASKQLKHPQFMLRNTETSETS